MIDDLDAQEQNILKRLREIREQKGISQLELSFESGVSQNMITYIENGKRTPTLKTVLKLCNALKINPATLFEKSDSEKAEARKTIVELLEKYLL